MGARDKDAPTAVRELTDHALSLFDEWNPETYEKVFCPGLQSKESQTGLRSLGQGLALCSVTKSTISSASGAVFEISCSGELLRLKVEVEGESERICTFQFET